MEFKNRISDKTNRRKLNIVTGPNAGSDMVVDIMRADEDVSEVGTPINAQTFNDWNSIVTNAKTIIEANDSKVAKLVSAPDCTSANVYGDVKVEINSAGKLKFSNLKGEPGIGLNFTGDWIANKLYHKNNKIVDVVRWGGKLYILLNDGDYQSSTFDSTKWMILLEKGADGVQGIQGVKGDKGDVGAIGPRGIAGPPGIAGAQGLKGDKGNTGDRGIQGVAGAQGVKGDKGDMALLDKSVFYAQSDASTIGSYTDLNTLGNSLLNYFTNRTGSVRIGYIGSLQQGVLRNILGDSGLSSYVQVSATQLQNVYLGGIAFIITAVDSGNANGGIRQKHIWRYDNTKSWNMTGWSNLQDSVINDVVNVTPADVTGTTAPFTANITPSAKVDKNRNFQICIYPKDASTSEFLRTQINNNFVTYTNGQVQFQLKSKNFATLSLLLAYMYY